MPRIGKVTTVTLKIWKQKDGVFDNNRIYATIVENDANEYIKQLLKDHAEADQHDYGLHHLDISL